MPTVNIEPPVATEVECTVRGCRFAMRLATIYEVDQWYNRPTHVSWRGIETSSGLVCLARGKLPVGASPEEDRLVDGEIQLAAEHAARVLGRWIRLSLEP